MKIQPVSNPVAAGMSLLCLGAFPQATLSSAWTRNDGDLLMLTPISYTYAEEAFDANGDRVDRRRFEMSEFSPKVEYGLTDSLTVGLQPKFRHVVIETEEGNESNSGLAETDLFARHRLWQQGNASVSLKGMVKVPVDPKENEEVAIGRDQVDAEVSLAFGNRHAIRSGRVFYSAEVGYRRRWDVNVDQASANFFVGWAPYDSSWSFIFRSANTMSVSKDNDETEVLAMLPDYTRHDAQLMASYRFSNSMSLAGGVSKTYAGENVGIGNTAFLALSTPF